MDGDALQRLGRHVVSRRVALGYRTRTELANSLMFTVRTLADIENGVRRASPGTYAMLENKLAWAPGSIRSKITRSTGDCAIILRIPAPSCAVETL